MLTNKFRYEINSGFLDILVPSNYYYMNFTLMSEDKVFGDSRERTKWRTKQNLDFAYIMAYARNRSTYYLQVLIDI